MLMVTKQKEVSFGTEREASGAQRQLARTLREIEKTRTRAAERIDAINAAADNQVAILTNHAIALANALEAYATREREFAKGKTVTIASAGVVRWLDSPPALEIDDISALLAQLRKRKRHRYIRVREEIDKSALLRALLRRPHIAAQLPGVRVARSSRILIQPSGSVLGIERPESRRRWRVR